MRGKWIPIALPNTGAIPRRRFSFYLRSLSIICVFLYGLLQIISVNYDDYRDIPASETTNDSANAILSMVPPVFHKFLTSKGTTAGNNSTTNTNISEIQQSIMRYNDMQLVLNEETYGPLQNDSVIIVVQVHKRIEYLRHLIVSLAQARDISKTLLIFSHDYYDEEINDLVQSVDFCKVMQIFYPFSIQTHPHEFPGADPGDCPRNIKKEQALLLKCNNALYPDVYGHYREAAFTQTKHHWWWKANRVFDQLDVTRHHTGLVVFLEEDHYVAEDFLYLLDLMEKKSSELCPKCNILSLGTYLKTFNYYTYKNDKQNRKAFVGQSHNTASASNFIVQTNHENKIKNNNNNNNHKNALLMPSIGIGVNGNGYVNNHINNNNYGINGGISGGISNIVSLRNHDKLMNGVSLGGGGINGGNNNNNVGVKKYSGHFYNEQQGNHQQQKQQQHSNSLTTEKPTPQSWGYQVLPSLYSVYQKVDVTPWISSKHNMGMAFHRSTWRTIVKCGKHFCTYDDYNWDWSLQHVSQQCLKQKLHAMVVKGPRVFHIGECGVHHKKSNCETNRVISKVQQVLRVATRSQHLYPKTITLTIASIGKKTKLREGNGGWGDKRDHLLCINMTIPHYMYS